MTGVDLYSLSPSPTTAEAKNYQAAKGQQGNSGDDKNNQKSKAEAHRRS
jgi:hypothetical protein